MAIGLGLQPVKDPNSTVLNLPEDLDSPASRTIVTSVAIEVDQPRVTDPEVIRDLVEQDVSDLAAKTISVKPDQLATRRVADVRILTRRSLEQRKRYHHPRRVRIRPVRAT